MKPFPKVFHIGEKFVEKLFDGEVEITEKIDGSQFDFGINKDGEMVMRSKGQELSNNYVESMFKTAMERSAEALEKVKSAGFKDIYFYCEYLNNPNHNTLKYSRTPKNNLYLFAASHSETEFLDDSDQLKSLATDLLDIEPVNVLYKGRIDDLEKLKELLNSDSVLGGEKIEGIVVKNYKVPTIIGSDLFFPLSAGKYVKEEFKERNVTNWKTEHSSKSKVKSLIDGLSSEVRWNKIVRRMTEENRLANSPKDIGPLIPIIIDDVLTEETENIKEELFEIFKKDIERASIKGFPEWYKESILKKVFNIK